MHAGVLSLVVLRVPSDKYRERMHLSLGFW